MLKRSFPSLATLVIPLLFCAAAPSFGQDGTGTYSIHADTVQKTKRDGVTVTTYSGHARVEISTLLIEGQTIAIFGDGALPSRIEASGDPLKFRQRTSSNGFSGTAQKVILQVSQLKLTLINYLVTDSSGNRMKGKEANFVLKP